MDKNNYNVLLTEYKSCRAEIEARGREQVTLLTYVVIGTIAILAFAIETQSSILTTLAFAVIIPLGVGIVESRHGSYKIGAYIRCKFEDGHFNNIMSLETYSHYIGSPGKGQRDLLFSIFSFVPLLVSIAILFIRDTNLNMAIIEVALNVSIVEIIAIILNIIFGIMCFIIVVRPLKVLGPQLHEKLYKEWRQKLESVNKKEII